METDSPFNFEVIASGTDEIDNVKLFRGLELLGESMRRKRNIFNREND